MYHNDNDPVPASRTCDLGTGPLPRMMKKTEYVELFLNCRLSSHQKMLLLYFAHRYNFKAERPTMMSLRRAANDLSIDKATYLKYRKQLEELGWIQVINGDQRSTSQVILRIGYEVPELEWKEPGTKRDQLRREQQRKSLM